MLRWLKACCFDKHHRDRVWVAVCGRSPILEVTVAVFAHLAWNSNAGASVSHTRRKVADTASFVTTC